MKSVRITIIVLVTIVGGFLLLPLLNLHPPAVFWSLMFPLPVAAIHIISAQALFTETKLRKESEKEIFLNLDPFFWGLAGLAFGILGMIAFRVLNDHFSLGTLTESNNKSLNRGGE